MAPVARASLARDVTRERQAALPVRRVDSSTTVTGTSVFFSTGSPRAAATAALTASAPISRADQATDASTRRRS